MSDLTALGNAQLVRLSGADARSFAQAQFCSDVATLPANDWQWSAWLDAKGRVRYLFALIDAGDDSLLAWLPLGDAAAFALELGRFLFRSKVTITALDGWNLRGNFDAPPGSPALRREGESLELLLDGAQPRLLSLTPGTVSAVDDDAVRRWRGRDVADGLPLIDSACASEFVPQALGLERLGAISFRKGCYPGQEVAARLHFRGGNKRGLRRIRWAAGVAESGANLTRSDAQASLGSLLYAGSDQNGSVGLVVLVDPETSGETVIAPCISAQIDPIS